MHAVPAMAQSSAGTGSSTSSSPNSLPLTGRSASCSRSVAAAAAAPASAPAPAPPPAVSDAASSRKRRRRAPGSAPLQASLELWSGVTAPEATAVEAAAPVPPARPDCSARTCSTMTAKCWYSTAARSPARRCARCRRRASARSRRCASGRSSTSAARGSRSPRPGVRAGCLPGVATLDFLGVWQRPTAGPAEAPPSWSTTESKK
mmetsp:Transcript_75311/g.238022  ORF Transcript_75311/g.238022 Transcript_75311/m.238022 type:complete len:205 (-) Transcript_75311:2040-2654(-)